MILTCPHCGETIPLDTAAKAAELIRYGELVGRFGAANQSLVLGFLDCFRKPGGNVSLGRRVRVLASLWGLIDKGELQFDRKVWRVDYRLVLEAMAETARSADRKGLTNLNYFSRVLSSKADQVEAQAERAREAERQAGAHRPARKGDGPRPLAEALPQPAPAPAPKVDDADRLPRPAKPLQIGPPTSGDRCLPEGAHPSRLDWYTCETCAKLTPAESGAGWRCRDIARQHQKSPSDRACRPNYQPKEVPHAPQDQPADRAGQ